MIVFNNFKVKHEVLTTEVPLTNKKLLTFMKGIVKKINGSYFNESSDFYSKFCLIETRLKERITIIVLTVFMTYVLIISI